MGLLWVVSGGMGGGVGGWFEWSRRKEEQGTLCHWSNPNPNQDERKIFFHGTSYVSPIHWNVLLLKFTSGLHDVLWRPVVVKYIHILCLLDGVGP